MNTLRIVALFALALGVGASLGCSSEGGEVDGTGGDGTGGEGTGGTGAVGGGGNGGTGGDVPLSVEFTIEDASDQGVEGAQICEGDTNCGTTDENGMVTIDFPFAQDVLYTVSKDGYAAELYGDVSDLTFGTSRGHTLFTNQEVDDLAMMIDSTWPHAGTGWVSLGVNLEGVTFTLIGGTGIQSYVDTDGTPSTELDATTSGSIAGVRGAFSEVAPGMYEVEYGGTATDCTASIGWPSETPNRVRVEVRAEHLTYASMTCVMAE